MCFENLLHKKHDIIEQALFDKNIWHRALSDMNCEIPPTMTVVESWISPPLVGLRLTIMRVFR